MRIYPAIRARIGEWNYHIIRMECQRMTCYGRVSGLLLAVLIATCSLAHAQWRQITTGPDPMSDAVDYGTMSSLVKPLSPMGFPYDLLEAWVHYTCVGHMVIAFNGTPPGLADGKPSPSNEATVHEMRIRWDRDAPDEVLVVQSTKDDFFFFPDPGLKHQLATRTTLTVEFPWELVPTSVFRWELTGSSTAITTVDEKCNAR